MPTQSDFNGEQPFDDLSAGAAAARARIDALTLGQRDLNDQLVISNRSAQQFGRALTSAFVGLAVQGRSVGDVMRSLALSLSRLALSAAFKPLESLIGGAFQGLFSGAALTSPFSSGGIIATPASFPRLGDAALSGALRGVAGVATSASAYPSAPAVAGAGPSVVFNVTAGDAESFRRSETQLAAMLSRVVSQGQRNL